MHAYIFLLEIKFTKILHTNEMPQFFEIPQFLSFHQFRYKQLFYLNTFNYGQRWTKHDKHITTTILFPFFHSLSTSISYSMKVSVCTTSMKIKPLLENLRKLNKVMTPILFF